MINKFYIVELKDSDNILSPVLIDETNLADFLKNYDKDTYSINAIHTVGEIFLDSAEFLDKEKDLETGKKDEGGK